MKTILIILFLSLHVFATEDTDPDLQNLPEKFKTGDQSVSIGTGLHGEKGLLGLSYEKFIFPGDILNTDMFNTNEISLVASASFDFIGSTASLNIRKYFSHTTHQPIFFKSFIQDSFFASLGAQYAASTTSTITDSLGVRKYNTSEKYFALLNLGWRALYTKHFFTELELSYRQILSGGKSTQLDGLSHDDTSLLETGYRTLGLSISIGWLF